MDAFFFPTGDDLQLFGVWRGPQNARRAWILCPPFAEEEKSARRVLTLIAQKLESRGEASLLFSFRGTGDSQGELQNSTLSAWRKDLGMARTELQNRAPDAEIALLGVRLGASLAAQEAANLGAQKLVLIEPLLSGRSFLMQQNAKKQIRAQLTGETSDQGAQNADFDDLDGWALGIAMKSELSALNLTREIPTFEGETTVLQCGPRAEIAPPLQQLASQLNATTGAVVMPAFWNLIDYADPSLLLAKLETEAFND
ncbi:MAG TPA: hypothetical protein VGB45_10770 [Abditibacterium sp.]